MHGTKAKAMYNSTLVCFPSPMELKSDGKYPSGRESIEFDEGATLKSELSVEKFSFSGAIIDIPEFIFRNAFRADVLILLNGNAAKPSAKAKK